MPKLNPNAAKAAIDTVDIKQEKLFPKFLTEIRLEPFRHIDRLRINFSSPISVISGTNRSGKSTLLMGIACSHFDFQKRNIKNGNLERQTWSSLMKFTDHDKQTRDWTYHIGYKTGKKVELKRGQRKQSTKKWNGVGKKESQIKDRQVIFIDLDRVMPARNFNSKIYSLAKKSTVSAISLSKIKEIEEYISYVLEENFKLNKLAKHLDKDIFKYKSQNEYSSFNAATGEEVLTKIIIDIVEAKEHSLILIDEIELGLHPKIQRRLIDVLYHIANSNNKQFILTSHSPTILSSVPEKSRVFIEKQNDGSFKAIHNISVNAAMSKMDSISYPLFDLFCEDECGKKIIIKAISIIQQTKGISNFGNLVNVIVSGSADSTYLNFKTHERTYPDKKIKIGYACILDGDMKNQKKDGKPMYPQQDGLHFLHSDTAPEVFLLKAYLQANPNTNLQYHVDNSNVHSLLTKMIENSVATTINEAFELCWSEFIKTFDGKAYFESLIKFLLDTSKRFSPDL